MTPFQIPELLAPDRFPQPPGCQARLAPCRMVLPLPRLPCPRRCCLRPLSRCRNQGGRDQDLLPRPRAPHRYLRIRRPKAHPGLQNRCHSLQNVRRPTEIQDHLAGTSHDARRRKEQGSPSDAENCPQPLTPRDPAAPRPRPPPWELRQMLWPRLAFDFSTRRLFCVRPVRLREN